VTGASGFIGRNITQVLVRNGYRVRAQYRRADPPEALRDAARMGAELVRADLRDTNAPTDLVRGVQCVIHSAGLVAMTGPRGQFEDTNIGATAALLSAASSAHCDKFVYVSSMSVHGFGKHVESDETGPYYRLCSHYQRSKKAAENMVTSYDTRKLAWSILRPGLVYGPGDTTTLKLVFDLLASGKLPMLGGFGVYNCLVYIDDLVQAIVRALESDRATGEIFDIANGEKVLLRDAVKYAALLMGTPAPRYSIPKWLVSVAAYVLESLYRLPLLRGEPIITRYLATQLSWDFHFSSQKSVRLLGYAPQVSWREGIRRAVEAYKKADG
jgi:2-alkyl-3-oxoalkanoate reductase